MNGQGFDEETRGGDAEALIGDKLAKIPLLGTNQVLTIQFIRTA